jgi:hypothetical protein
MKKLLLVIVGVLIVAGIYFVLHGRGQSLADGQEFIKTDVTAFQSTYGKGGNSGNVTYATKFIELTDDSDNEIIVSNLKSDGVFMGGASGNQQYLVYGKVNSRWKRIGELSGNQYAVLSDKTDGYHDIKTVWHMSATSQTETIYKWSSSQHKYSEASSKIIDATQ